MTKCQHLGNCKIEKDIVKSISILSLTQILHPVGQFPSLAQAYSPASQPEHVFSPCFLPVGHLKHLLVIPESGAKVRIGHSLHFIAS